MSVRQLVRIAALTGLTALTFQWFNTLLIATIRALGEEITNAARSKDNRYNANDGGTITENGT